LVLVQQHYQIDLAGQQNDLEKLKMVSAQVPSDFSRVFS
jgi:hypothetical protein